MHKFLAYTFITAFAVLGLAEGAQTINKSPSQILADSAVVLPAQPHWLQKIFEPGTSYLKREGVESA
jgi:hypothetical protein